MPQPPRKRAKRAKAADPEPEEPEIVERSDEEASTNESSQDDASDGATEELRLTEDGRIAYEGRMDMNFQTYPCALLDLIKPGFQATLARIVKDCREVCNVRARGASYSSGETFWVPADATPRTVLESMALHIFRFHTRAATFDAKSSGAEWWTQVIDGDDDIGWHWDKDYAAESSGLNIHPHLGTVTYFSSHGGPTMVLEHAGPLQKADSCALADIAQGWLSVPKLGKHMAFDGRYLHGASSDVARLMGIVAPEQQDGARAPRVTFLVNIWLNHRPDMASPLSEDVARKLSQGPGPELRLPRDAPLCVAGRDAITEIRVQATEGAEFTWNFSESQEDEDDETMYVVAVRLPGEALARQVAAGRDAFHLVFEPGCAAVEEGADGPSSTAST